MNSQFSILLLSLLLVSNLGFTQGRQTATRNYDPNTVTTIRGTVSAVQKQLHGKGSSAGIHLLLQTQSETIAVHLGPQWYIEKQSVSFAQGDAVEVEGSRVQMNAQPVIIAKTVKKGKQKLELRTQDGTPLWSRNMQR